MLQELETLTAEIITVEPLSALRGATVAIDASKYLSRFLFPSPVVEPLLPALGGLPFTMRKVVADDLARLGKLDIKPVFYFDGLEYGTQYAPFEESDHSARVHAEAWKLYSRQEPEEAVKTFGKSKAFQPKEFFRLFQSILTERSIEFRVAPYSVWAQMAYLEKEGGDFYDACIGAWEMLIFDVDKVVVKLDTSGETFSWVSKAHLLKHFDISPDAFLDAALISGSTLLPAYPIANPNPMRPVPKLKLALDMLNSYGRSANTFIGQQEGPGRPEEDGLNGSGGGPPQSYLDRYRRVYMAVKHHCVMTSEGRVSPLLPEMIPKDLHMLIAPRLPDELYYYLSRGLISPRLLNWRTSGEIVVHAPLDGGDSDEYKSLVLEKLNPVRVKALFFLSQPLTRFYLYKEVVLRVWYDRGRTVTVYDKSSTEGIPNVSSWALQEGAFSDLVPPTGGRQYIQQAANCLKDHVFVQNSLNANEGYQLATKDEVIFNVIWRFFQANGYLDEQHETTKWGKMLFTMLDFLKDEPELHEMAMIATELARHGLLNSRNMFPTYSVPPPYMSEEDYSNTLLVSRVACLAKLRHESIGFTGPLSRHLLAYNCIISSVRSSLRDLVESITVNLFLKGGADRSQEGLPEISMELPFLLQNDCSLGIAVQSYLHALIETDGPKTSGVKGSLLFKGATEWFPHSTHFLEDIQKAFKVWDAVYVGVRASVGLVPNVAEFETANEWLKELR